MTTETCQTGKLMHETRELAQRQLVSFKTTKGKGSGGGKRGAGGRPNKQGGGKVLNVYRCPLCDHWHVGHTAP